jgi:hypothetical protein
MQILGPGSDEIVLWGDPICLISCHYSCGPGRSNLCSGETPSVPATSAPLLPNPNTVNRANAKQYPGTI